MAVPDVHKHVWIVYVQNGVPVVCYNREEVAALRAKLASEGLQTWKFKYTLSAWREGKLDP